MKRLWIAVAAALLVLGYGVAAFVVSPDDPVLEAHGSSWNDAGAVRDALERENLDVRTLFTSPLAIDTAPERTAYIALGLERAYTPEEVDRLVALVDAGASIVIADQGRHMAAIAGAYGVHVVDQAIFDPTFDTASDHVLVSVEGSLDGKGYGLLASDPRPLATGTDRPWQTLAATTADAFVDTDGDGEAGLGDKKGAAPIAVRHDTPAGGSVVLVSPPSLFMDLFAQPDRHGVDAALDEAEVDQRVENLAFARDLIVSLLPEGGTVLFDESRHVQAEPSQSLARVFTPIVRLTADDTAALAIGPDHVRVPAVYLVALALAAGGLFLVGRIPSAADWFHSYRPETAPTPATLRSGDAQQIEALVWEALRQEHNLSRVEFEHLDEARRLALAKGPLRRFVEGHHDSETGDAVLRQLESRLHIEEVTTI